MNYKHYSVEDFVLDESFRKWVLNADKASDLFWSQWLEDHPQKAETIRQAIELLRKIPVQQDILNEEQLSSISQAIEQGIDRLEENVVPENKVVPISAYAMARQKSRQSSPVKDKSFSFIKVAACVIFILCMGYFAYLEREKRASEIVYEQVVKENPQGQKLTVFLSDGSKVILNAGSKLSFTKPFHPDSRVVRLQGEAFFEVAKDSLRPFQVHTGRLATTALGTSFNIAAYPDDDHIKVSLTSGKVKVGLQQQNKKQQETEVYFLAPGEQLDYQADKSMFQKKTFGADEVLAWKEGVIYLNHADQAAVVKTLERWYGMQVEVQGRNDVVWDVTAKFDNQSLKSVLTSLSYTLNFAFEIKADSVIINY